MRNIIQSGGEWFAEAQRRVQSILPGKRKDDATDDPPPVDADASDPADETALKKRSLASLREWVDQSKHRLDEWQKHVDTKIRTTIDGISQTLTPWGSVNKDVRALADRIAELEAKLREIETPRRSLASPDLAGPRLVRPRQASSGLVGPRQISTSLVGPRQISTSLVGPRSSGLVGPRTRPVGALSGLRPNRGLVNRRRGLCSPWPSRRP